MKIVKDLNLGFSDAINYLQRGNKELFSSVFVKNEYLDELKKTNVYYLIGEKGTGKTAYAAYCNNNETDSDKAFLKYICNTDYEKFYELKKQKRIDVSGYADVWKVILLLLMAQFVTDNKKVIAPLNKSNLPQIMKAIDEYYNRAFSPEIENALRIVDKSGLMAKLVCQYAETGGQIESTEEFTEQKLQMNLYYIFQHFSEYLGKLKLQKNVILFVDGIDVRPSQIPYDDYLECIKGLSQACWALNTELFCNVRDSRGQFRIVLLLRPDIFNSLNLQNATNKLADNSVYLEWRTTYADYRNSSLYRVAAKLLSYEQNKEVVNDIWEYYFPWRLDSSNKSERDYDTAFMAFLKISLSRPRDIQRIMSLIKNAMKRRGLSDAAVFDYDSFLSDQFQNEYSEYFLGSLKDQLSFYYSDEDYQHFKKFFDFFSKPSFTYKEYEEKYNKYTDYIIANAKEIPKFVEDKREFLQLLYDSNIIAVKDSKGYFHFSYREKSPTNISPKVMYGDDVTYMFHYGLYKKAGMGRYV